MAVENSVSAGFGFGIHLELFTLNGINQVGGLFNEAKAKFRFETRLVFLKPIFKELK